MAQKTSNKPASKSKALAKAADFSTNVADRRLYGMDPPGFPASAAPSGMDMLRPSGMFLGDDRTTIDPYTVIGQQLLNSHSWRQTVYLVEFLTTTDWKTKTRPDDPPTEDSIVKGEIANIVKLQQSEAFVIRLDDILKQSYDFVGLFENRVRFDSFTHPTTSILVQLANSIAWHVVQYHKEKFYRKRPTEYSSEVRAVIKVPSFSAYPSGHATQSFITYQTLKALNAGRQEFDDAAAEGLANAIAVNREYAGVHYASDTKAGITLAAALWSLMATNAAIGKLIDTAKQEWNRAPGSEYRVL